MPSTSQYLGHALDAAIRSRVKDRAWYRRNRDIFAWGDLERENDRELRTLFAIRSEGRRAERDSRAAVERAYHEMRAAHEVVEAALWAESVAMGRYIVVPDAPLADRGDHFVYPDSAA